MITFEVTGATDSMAAALMDLAHPILVEAGMPVDICTVKVSNAIVRDYRKGKPLGASPVTFYFPSFKALHKKGRSAELDLAKKLSKALGCICHTLDAQPVASFDEVP